MFVDEFHPTIDWRAALISILHISDLHRTPGENISNAELISALLGDRNRYVRESPAIRPPDAIIVSGDIIQGVPLGESNASAKLAEQYRIAEDFLGELTNRLLDGDRSKVVIVPGNHDIDWVTAFASMRVVPDEEAPADISKALFSENTEYRWSWRERQLYQVNDIALYERRLDAFWDFFERFYSGLTGLLRVARGSPANLFSLADGRIGVAAFNSCHGNDCFAFHGSIPRGVVAQVRCDILYIDRE